MALLEKFVVWVYEVNLKEKYVAQMTPYKITNNKS